MVLSKIFISIQALSLGTWTIQVKMEQASGREKTMNNFLAGVLWRSLSHRNGTFEPPAPPTRTRRRVKTDFRRKTGRSGPFFHQFGRFQGVRRPKFQCGRSRQFDFSRCTPETGRFGRFSGPRGPKCSVHFLHLTQKERCTGQAECTQVIFSHINIGSLKKKCNSGPFRAPRAETRFGKLPKMVEGHCTLEKL